jgi:hypothetical protein
MLWSRQQLRGYRRQQEALRYQDQNEIGATTMKRQSGITLCSASACLALAAAAIVSVTDAKAERIPLKATTMIIEYNDSAEDIGIQFFLDSDGWRSVEIFDPRGQEIFDAETEGRLTRQGGGTELFLESVEPELAELPLEKFFKRFPEGNYKFRARDNDGNLQTGRARFTHDIPAGPELIVPVPIADAECAMDVPLPVEIMWNAVTTSIDDEPLDIVGYEVIVENDGLNFDVKFPAEIGTMLTVPLGLLQPGHEYIFEVLAVEESGNQTITEGCFTTAE